MAIFHSGGARGDEEAPGDGAAALRPRCGVVRVGAPSPETRLGSYDSWKLRTFASVEPSWPSVSDRALILNID